MGRKSKSSISVIDRIESVEDRRQLSALVKDYPCLWRLADPGYANRDAKNAAWVAVSEGLGKSGKLNC